jgi:hypothetical protein
MKQFDSCQIIPIIKYFTVFPFALYTKNEVEPSSHSNKWMCSGAIRRYLKRRLVGHSSKTTKLWWSILQGLKRGCEYAPGEYVQQAYEKHAKKMIADPALLEGENSLHTRFSEKFIQKAKQVTTGFVYTQEMIARDNLRARQISSSACFENSKTNGGSLNYLLDLSYGSLKTKYGICRHNLDRDLIRMYQVNSSRIVTVYGYIAMTHDEVRLSLAIEEIEEEEINGIVKTERCCKTYGVLEPLKVRMITKGESQPYYFAKPFQKRLWSYLQEHSQFAVTGQTIDKSHIYDLIGKTKNLEQRYGLIYKFNKFVSGDYSAATDNLSIGSTKCVFEEFLNRSDLSFGDKERYREVLYQHEVFYPEKESGGIEPLTQTNGQLMGSPLSFPILCVVNLICYWIALEYYMQGYLEYNESIPIELLPVIINGDDILFCCNDSLYSIWQETIRYVGFELSIGKNYIHEKLLTANSRLYEYDSDKNIVTEIPFFNVGLLLGQSKVGQDDRNRQLIGEEAEQSLRGVYNCVLEGCNNKLRTHNRFMYYHKEQIPRCRENYFASISLGGLGFRLYDEVKPYVTFTPYQRCLASQFLNGEGVTCGFVSSSRQNFPNKELSTQKVLVPYGPLREWEFEFDGDVYIENAIRPEDVSLRYVHSKLASKYKPYQGDLTIEYRIVHVNTIIKDISTIQTTDCTVEPADRSEDILDILLSDESL